MKNRSVFSPKNWLRAGLLTAFAASFSLNLQAQIAPAKLWDKTFGGSSENVLKCLKQTSDGGYILGGYSNSNISGNKTQGCLGGRDYWVVKLDASGNKTWDKTFGGSGSDELYALQQTSDGGYILGGTSDSGISGDKSQANKGTSNTCDYWIVKLDASGSKTWDRTIGGSNEDLLGSLQQTSDGGYILGGSSFSGISGDKSQASQPSGDYWVVKLDASGSKTWDKTLVGNYFDHFTSLQQTSDGGYILGGSSASDIGGDKSQANKGIFDTYDYWVIKLDANGNKTWDKTFGGNDNEFLNSMQQTSDGGYILGGSSASGIGGDKSQANKGPNYTYDYWVVKLDSIGNKNWDKTIGGNSSDDLKSLQHTSDGGYILGGTSFSGISGDKTQASQGSNDYWLVKLDAVGSIVWDATFGGSNNDDLSSLQQTSDGGYILGGASKSGLSGDKSQASKGQNDYWIVKLAGNITGIKEAEAEVAVSIFPNPSQGKFNLELSGLNSQTVGVTVSDLLGRVVMQREIKATDQHIYRELELPSTKGIYMIQLKAGAQTITRKIVVE